ncbi:MAG: hypothetical protein K8R36_04860 [Planctomycetales bacterium]|nr:hypothetical protein [Planctomycetales bacterium]
MQLSGDLVSPYRAPGNRAIDVPTAKGVGKGFRKVVDRFPEDVAAKTLPDPVRTLCLGDSSD